MIADRTLWDEVISAATRSGWFGSLCLVLFAAVYLSSLWFVIRRQPQHVFENVVRSLFLVAAFHLQGVWFTFHNLQYAAASCFQSSLLWWGSYLRLQLALFLVLSLAPVVLLAVLVRPRAVPLRNPGCIPGALMSLLGAVVLDLLVLTSVFGSLYYRVTDDIQSREQGRRQPEGPAKALLTIASRNPAAVLDALHAQRGGPTTKSRRLSNRATRVSNA